jgi:zinc protease
VRKDQLAVQVGVSNESFSQLGKFSIYVVVKPGVDPAVVDKRIDEIVGDFLKNGPTADEVQRYVASTAAQTIAGYESVGGFGGKAVALASGELYSNDPGFYKKQLEDLAAETPQDVKAVAQKWLGRPVYALTIVPGPRDAYAEAAEPKPVPDTGKDDRVVGNRGPLPNVGAIPALAFPKVERTKLDNGIELVYAQRTTVPLTRINMSFDAGTAADVSDKLGTEAMTLAMMDEGTTHRDSEQLAKDEESLGANIGEYADADRSTVGVFTPSLNLAPALDLFADVVRNPAFAPAEVARVKNQQLAQIAQELADPNGLAARTLPKVVFPAGSPYAKEDGSGNPAAVGSLTRDDLVAFQQAWLRPDKAKIFIVSDRPLAEIKAALNAHFADWKGNGAPGVKSFPDAAATQVKPRIVLVDRKDSPQSLIIGGAPNTLKGTDNLLPLQVASNGLGESILSRINEDLRETRHWSYGSYGYFDRKEMAAPYEVQAPVQADKTGESITSLRGDISAYLGDKPMTPEEFDRATTGAIRSLSGNFETSDAVLRAMQTNDLFKRPDDYYSTITARYHALTLPQVMTALKGTLNPDGFVWVVVGDADAVKPQLDSVGLPVEVMPATAIAGGN